MLSSCYVVTFPEKTLKTLYVHWMPFRKDTRTQKQCCSCLSFVLACSLCTRCEKETVVAAAYCGVMCQYLQGSNPWDLAFSLTRICVPRGWFFCLRCLLFLFIVFVSDRCIHFPTANAQIQVFMPWLWLGRHGRRTARSIWWIDVQSASGHRWELFYLHKRFFDGKTHRFASNEIFWLMSLKQLIVRVLVCTIVVKTSIIHPEGLGMFQLRCSAWKTSY